jgi:hypothetical protein
MTKETKESPATTEEPQQTTISQILEEWPNNYSPPSDFNCINNEIDWGPRKGKEIW